MNKKMYLWAVILTIGGIVSYADGPYFTRREARLVKKAELEDYAAYPEVDHSKWKFTIVKLYNLTTLELLGKKYAQ